MFRPMATGRINDNLYVIRTGIVNFYLYDTGEALIAFDAGLSVWLARAGFKKLGFDYNRVSHVFLTHSDFDHTGGLRMFEKAKVYISKKEEPMITYKKARKSFFYNKHIKDCNFMEDSETIQIGSTEVRLAISPGHTPGSALYTINDSILISGDAISLSGGGNIQPFGFLQNMNHTESKRTVERLKAEGIFNKMSLIVTGHHGMINRR